MDQATPASLPSRRRWLREAGGGFGSLALSAMLFKDGVAKANPLAGYAPPNGRPHFRPRAKSVIWIFLCGGVSHLESFDPKPELNKYAGKSIGDTPYKEVLDPKRVNANIVGANPAHGDRKTIMPLQTGYRAYGQSGLLVGDWFSSIGQCADDIAVVRSLWTIHNDHGAQLASALEELGPCFIKLGQLMSTRPDLPPPSYVLHSSPGRLHVLWRVRDIAPSRVEQLQKQLARELLTDRAATSCTQTTRLPGFFNHKRQPSVRVGIEYLHWRDVFVARDLPAVGAGTTPSSMTKARRPLPATRSVERARAFLQCVDPAVAGQQGDLRTFRVCCRIVRGFDLSDDEAVRALSEWNARCEPPWSERELRQKVMNARRYGREPEGGLL